MFGKEPELYYKGSNKKTTLIGRIFSISFITIYFVFFVYKLIRMLKKKDVTFYDTFTYAEEPPSVKITKENFYGGFALEDPNTYDVFIDEGVYIPKAYFKKAERKGDIFDWQIIELELERCKVENFGSLYQEKFKAKTLNNSYCFKDMDFVLEGHFSYDLYSFFYIQFFPCVNTTEKQNCKPLEIIDYYLKNTFVSFQFQDIELTPNNYKNPFRPRDVDIYTTVGKNMFKEIHAFFQVVDIQTDMDWLGFDEFENIKSEKFLKYDETIIMSNIIDDDIYINGDSFCDFTIKLSENVRTERRTYTKLIAILGDIGGLMEVVYTLLKIISSFAGDILYEIALVNNLFSFDLNNKVIILKDKKNVKKIEFMKEKEEDSKTYSSINSLQKMTIQNTFINDDMNIPSRNRFKEDTTYRNKYDKENNENVEVMKFPKKKAFLRRKSNITSNESKNKMILTSNNINIYKSPNNFDQKEIQFYPNLNNRNVQKANREQNRNIINKIKYNKSCIYFFFCFVRKRKTMENILLDEGMNIIVEKIDIFNIFEKMYKYDEIKVINKKIIEMSDESKIKMKAINNNKTN